MNRQIENHMSYSNINAFKNLVGKKVLFFDTETSGLPTSVSNGGAKPEFRYPDITSGSYDSSRIVSIGWYYSENFSFQDNIDQKDIKTIIRKPSSKDKFTIPQKVINIHGITNKMMRQNGVFMSKILNEDFGVAIRECDYIVAYNAFFDVKILQNETYRVGFTMKLKKLQKLEKEQKVLCIGQLCALENCSTKTKKYYKYQIPKLTTVYKILCDGDCSNAHNADKDVLMMMEIMNKLIYDSEKKD